MAFTKSEIAANFALQMAEQARRFGEELRRARLAAGFAHQKDLVARMHELGDTGLNTNQVSRYENGEGPLPRESRLDLFAKALGVEGGELLAGTRKGVPAPDPFAAPDSDQLDRIEAKLDALLTRFDLSIPPGDPLTRAESAAADVLDDAADTPRRNAQRSEATKP